MLLARGWGEETEGVTIPFTGFEVAFFIFDGLALWSNIPNIYNLHSFKMNTSELNEHLHESPRNI